MYITNPGTMQYLYIHTDEQTAVFVIADDNISSIYLTRHQYFCGGSVAVDFLFIVTPIVGVFNVLCFGVCYLGPF